MTGPDWPNGAKQVQICDSISMPCLKGPSQQLSMKHKSFTHTMGEHMAPPNQQLHSWNLLPQADNPLGMSVSIPHTSCTVISTAFFLLLIIQHKLPIFFLPHPLFGSSTPPSSYRMCMANPHPLLLVGRLPVPTHPG